MWKVTDMNVHVGGCGTGLVQGQFRITQNHKTFMHNNMRLWKVIDWYSYLVLPTNKRPPKIQYLLTWTLYLEYLLNVFFFCCHIVLSNRKLKPWIDFLDKKKQFCSVCFHVTVVFYILFAKQRYKTALVQPTGKYTKVDSMWLYQRWTDTSD